MYWYYKAILLSIVAAVLYGIFTIVKPYLPDITVFSKPEQVETADNKKEDSPEDKKTVTQVTKTAVEEEVQRNPELDKDLTPAQNAALLEAKTLYKDKQLLDDAYKKAMELLEGPNMIQFSNGWYRVADLISEINTKLLFSSAPSERKEAHKVQSGDSLARISRGKTTIAALQKGNNIPLTSQTIHPGDFLRYFPGDWEIEIIKSEYILLLRHQGKFFKYYKVGIGKENRTPEGIFLVYGKVMDPIWERKGYEPIQPGDPRNVLGSRWMKLKPIKGTVMVGSGYGIHGTTQPDSVGTPASQGCIRMRNDQVEELFDIIPDTKVEVTIRK
ncbi:MAG: L,D-transpeptidase family protein [Lentisphaeraceae bacterium]|nr:L,D-transpeptidase family protein [Lentisphaeraceae bacterium]